MEISIFQIVLISLVAYLSALGVPWALGLTGGFYTLGRPLVAGMLVGIIMGDVQQGILIGVAIQAVFIALITPGGVASTEISYATYPAIAIAMALDMSPELAVTLSVALGTFGLIFFNFTQAFNSFWNSGVDKAAEQLDVAGIYRYAVIYPTLTVLLVRFSSTVALIYLGASAGEEILNIIPPILMNTMTVLGGILPAVGIAVLLATIIHKRLNWVYYLVGFTLVVFMQLNILAIAFFGVLFAVINYQINVSGSDDNGGNTSQIDDMEVQL